MNMGQKEKERCVDVLVIVAVIAAALLGVVAGTIVHIGGGEDIADRCHQGLWECGYEAL